VYANPLMGDVSRNTESKEPRNRLMPGELSGRLDAVRTRRTDRHSSGAKTWRMGLDLTRLRSVVIFSRIQNLPTLVASGGEKVSRCNFLAKRTC
jgi:hypothetical protein